MSDSDSDDSNNIFRFQTNDTVISARGPRSTVSSMGMSSHLLNSVNVPMNVNRNYAQSLYNEPRNHYRRETSPMSTMSAGPMRWRNFNPYSLHSRPMSSQRSMYNGRATSPSASIRSIGSSASVNTTNFLLAIENDHFNKSELKMMFNALNKRMKHNSRAKIKKLRERRFAQKYRHKSDYNSEASESSLSSDNQSITTSAYKENILSNRQFRSDMRNMQDKYTYRPNVTESYSQNFLRGMGDGPDFLHSTQTTCIGNSISNNFNSMHRKPNLSCMLQKDRFKSSNILPSQRFNREVASSVISEHGETAFPNRRNMFSRNGITDEIDARGDTDKGNNERIPETTGRTQKNMTKRKKNIDSDDEVFPNEKRSKISSPCKNMTTAKRATKENNTSDDFIFAKPSNPVRKTVNTGNKKVATKSPKIKRNVETHSPVISPIKPPREDKTLEKEKDLTENNAPNTSDVSLRPSFIKRKLFTQKLDITEQKNLSPEVRHSPQQGVYSLILKDKQKARKLQQSTTRSCLSRDLSEDENNLQDLIHKIVPPSEINVTKNTNIRNNRDSKDNDDESDTFTDEEIFNMTIKTNVSQKPVTKDISDCKVVAERMPSSNRLGTKSVVKEKNVTNKTASKGFWDTDYESDAESFQLNTSRVENTPHEENTMRNKGLSKVQSKISSKNVTSILPASNISTISQNTTFTNLQKFTNTTLRLKSHRANMRKELDKTKDSNSTKYTELQRKIAKEKAPPVANCPEIVEEKMNHEKRNEKNSKTQDRETKTKARDVENKSKKEKPSQVNKKQIKTPTKQPKNTSETNQKSKSVSPKTKGTKVKKNKIVESSQNTKNNKKQSTATPLKQIQNVETNNNQVVTPNKKANVKQKTETAKGRKTTKKNVINENAPNKAMNHNSVHKSKLNISVRSLRSAQNQSKNETINTSNSTNDNSFRCLRSRQIDLSVNDDMVTKAMGQDKCPQKLLPRWTRSYSRNHSNIDSSDVSFLLHNGKSPSICKKEPIKRTRTAIENTPMSKRLQNDLFVSKNVSISGRKRVPNKRYFIG